MKNTASFLILFLFLIFSCKTGTEKSANVAASQSESQVAVRTEGEILEEYLVASGDYVNSRQFPSMIKAEALLESLDSSTLVIDLRVEESFSKGHIKGSVNVSFRDLPTYFESTIRPYEYDKIVIVCDHGQRSSYTTMLLRLMGYGNVYCLRWGTAAWNPKLAGDWPWSVLIGSDWTSKLETKENPANAPGNYPTPGTGKNSGEEIFKERISQIFAEGFQYFSISAEEVFENPEKYYIINYERKDKYDSGHIPGAVRYKPGGTLGIASEMRTIPPDKEVVVYCATGHSSAFVVAYLRLLGYNAHTVTYGNNSFMHDQMLIDEERLSWEAFSEAGMISDFPFVK